MRRIITFFQEVFIEFKNISWPKRESLINLTIVVISISLIISLILGGFDYLFTQGIALLGQATRPVAPVNSGVNQLLTTPSPSPTPSIIESPTPTLKPIINKK